MTDMLLKQSSPSSLKAKVKLNVIKEHVIKDEGDISSQSFENSERVKRPYDRTKVEMVDLGE